MMTGIKWWCRAQTEKGTFCNDENVLYLVWGGSYLGIHNSKN